MKQITKFALILTAGLLTACNKDYSLKDAENYNKKTLGITRWNYIGEETEDDGDTVWTFQEKNERGFTWHVYEDHYMTGIDSASWEASRMYSDYDKMIIDYYLPGSGITAEGGDISEKDYYAEFSYTFTDRASLLKIIDEMDDFLAYLRSENNWYYTSKKEYQIRTDLEFKGPYNFSHSYYPSASVGSCEPLSEADEDFLVWAMCHGEETILKEYSAEEIDHVLQTNNSRIAIQTDSGKYRLTDTITLRGNTFIYADGMYMFLKNEGFAVNGTYDNYTFTGTDGYTYGPFKRSEYFSFHEIREMTGLSVMGEWDLNSIDVVN